MPRMGRRSILLGTAGLMLQARRARAAIEPALLQAANKEGRVVWYTSHYPSDTCGRISDAFSARYPEVKLDLVRATTQVAYQRLTQELRAGSLACDVISTSDVGNYVSLKQRGLLMAYQPDNLATMLALFRGLDPDGFFHSTSCGVVTITVKSGKIATADQPTNWPGLLDPHWRNAISVGHPAYSGYVGAWVVLMRKLYGDTFLASLKANDPLVGRSIQDTVTMLAAGERSLAAGNIASTLESAAHGNPLDITYPTDGVLLVDSPSAILKDAPHPNAAKLLMEFLTDPEVSRIIVREYGETMHKDVPPNPRERPLADVKVNRLNVTEITKGIPDAIEVWRDIFGI